MESMRKTNQNPEGGWNVFFVRGKDARRNMAGLSKERHEGQHENTNEENMVGDVLQDSLVISVDDDS